MRGTQEELKRPWSELRRIVASNRALEPLQFALGGLSSAFRRGGAFADGLTQEPSSTSARSTDLIEAAQRDNPLWAYFSAHTSGPGIWKWEHYFEIYHRHLSRFVGSPVDVLEIGIYSGGSLSMWESYFGGACHIYGVDLEEACKVYERDNVSVFIGDQEDREFWAHFRRSVKGIDILIDDGGHTPEQQMVTVEEMLPYLRPGGVYLCEDVHGIHNQFTAFTLGLVDSLNRVNNIPGPVLASTPSTFQQTVHSVHFYPYVAVIEKHLVPRRELVAPKHGSEWQPFEV